MIETFEDIRFRPATLALIEHANGNIIKIPLTRHVHSPRRQPPLIDLVFFLRIFFLRIAFPCGRLG